MSAPRAPLATAAGRLLSPAYALAALVLILLLSTPSLAERDTSLPHPNYVQRTAFEGALSPFYFFDDSETVIVFEGERAVVHRSTDAGAEWREVKDIPPERALALHRHPTDNRVAIVLGKRMKHWYTRDMGESWTEFETPDHPARMNPISFHADDSRKVLVNLGIGRDHASVYTTDGFKGKPKQLRKGAVQCMWAREKVQFQTGGENTDEDRILCLVEGLGGHPTTAERRLLFSDDYFDNEAEPPVESDRTARGFVSMVSATKFIYAARKADDSMEMALYVTTDGRTWNRALFGKQKLEADGFTVMEGTNYSARVDVLDGGGMFRLSPMGSLYSSNSNGTYFVSMEGYTNRNEFGFVDFENVDNIQGVALANIVDNFEKVRDGAQKRIKSQITFDDGRSWQPLKGTKWKKEGSPLHLHSYSEMRNQGKVFTNRGAPGLVMGVGNVGEILAPYEEGDLWISHDGGLTFPGWLAGAHKYEFGDSGAMLCAVYDEEKTDQVMWSSNYGLHWEGFKLVDPAKEQKGHEMMKAGLLTTVPDSTSTKFLLQSTTGIGRNTKHWVYAIDLAYWKGERHWDVCKESDFETWFARQGEDGEHGCIMGHTTSFRRRKQDAKCVVSKEFAEAQPVYEACECTDADFECDAEYERSTDRKSCVPITPQMPRESCDKPEDKYKGPSGFRKIPGNMCKENDLSKKKLGEVERSCKEAKGKKPAADGDIKSTMTNFDVVELGEYRYLEKPLKGNDDDEDVIMMVTAESRELWTSRDHGKRWARVKELADVEVLAIYVNPYERREAYFITPSELVYYTTDRGLTFKTFETPALPTNARTPILQFHPKQKNWLIFSGCGSKSRSSGTCSTTTWRTAKRGAEWEILIENAGSCEFVWQENRDVDEKLVYCSEERNPGRALLSSDDWFEKSNTIFEDIVNYATMDEFIVVATRDVEDPENLMLNASVDASLFAPARFPPKMNVRHDGYTVLDSSTNSIFVHATVNGKRDQEYGNIVKSNSNGTDFVLSLKDVNRNEGGYVDFEKLLGFKGAAVANVVTNVDDVNSGKRKVKRTMITHNDGADWKNLYAPTDLDGKPSLCDGKRPACALHLHGYTERKKPEESYSSPSAIGLVIGVGNVGDALEEYGTGDTFISRDGGVEWATAAKGQYMWEFGDQGSLIVLAPDNSKTDTIKYSTDEGLTFNDFKFTEGDTQVLISDITTTPNDASMMFLLWAHHVDGKPRAVTFNLDFSGLFDRPCKVDEEDPDKSDYEFWSPRHPLSDNDCLFGRVAQYHRKKQSSERCYNGPDLERLHAVTKICACTKTDFECDYNFQRGVDGLCHPVGEAADPKEACHANPDLVEYYDTIGYRRIPLDMCEGGDELDKVGEMHPCPAREDDFRKKHGTSGIAIFFAVVLSVGAAAALGWFAYTRLRGVGAPFGRIRLGAESSTSAGDASGRDSAWLRYPVAAVSALAAAAMAVPMVAASGLRMARDAFSRRRGGVGGGAFGLGGGRTYTSRRSFARGRGDYAAVGASDESDLLGEESDEEA